MFSHKSAAYAAAALGLLAAPAAFAAERSAEAQAVSVFHATCVVEQGNSAGIDKRLAPLVAKKKAMAIPTDDLTKRTGLKADHAWVVVTANNTQKLLVTTQDGICAVHVSDGDATRIRNDFKAAALLLAQATKAELVIKKNTATEQSYGVALPDAKTEPLLTLTTSDKQAASGTKHLMTFSVTKK